MRPIFAASGGCRRSCRPQNRSRGLAEDSVQRIDELQKGHARTRADIVDSSAHVRHTRGKSQRRGHVGNVNEVARLEPIAEDRRVAAGRERRGEDRDDARVGTVRALAGTEDVEEPQADGFQAVGVREGLAVELAREFRGRVWRESDKRRLFVLPGRVARASVGARAAGVDHTSRAEFPSCVEHVECPRRTDVVARQGVLDTLGDRSQCREVIDNFASGSCSGDNGGIGDRNANDLDTRH